MTSHPAPSAVVFVSHTGQMSGAEKVMGDLITTARAQGLQVTVVCPDGPVAQGLPDDVNHVPIPALGLAGEHGVARVAAAVQLVLRWVRAGRTIRAVRRATGGKVVVNSLFALPAALAAGVRHDASWLVHDTVVSGRQRAVVRLSRPAIGQAVAVSEATAAPLIALGVPVTVAHNGVTWPVPALSTDLHDPPVVGMLALLTPWKGHAVALDAVATLPDVVIELAGGSFPGDADHVAALHARADQPDLAGRVRFLGHVDPTEALSRWDAMISASVEPEAGPLSVLEAMARGKPVVGTDHGGTTEFLRDGAGVPVPPGDSAHLATAITTLLADDGLRASIAVTARDRIAREHDITDTLPRMLNALLA